MEWLVNNELEKTWKETVVVALFEVLLTTSGVLPGFEPCIPKYETGLLPT